MPKPSFNGLRVLSLESRRAAEMATLIANFGGRPTVAPALREVPLASNPDALEFGAELVQEGFDAVVFLTGVGARALLNVVATEQPREQFIDALCAVKVVVRGPKPLAVMREWGVPVWLAAPEPNTWRDVLDAIRARAGELPDQPRIAVQEYGTTNPELLDGLRALGAEVTAVPVYQWSLPEDVVPLQQAAAALAAGDLDVALFTTQVQVVHLFQVAAAMGREQDVHAGLTRTVIASIGPTTTDELRRRNLPVDLEASHPKMGVLVTEAAERSPALLKNKGRT